MPIATVDGRSVREEKTTRTILAIDDDPNIGPLLGKVLRQRGYDVVTASNGPEGLEKAARIRPDIVTLDIMMPKMDGWLVLKEMKRQEELRDIPVAILSICDERKLGHRLGAFDYLLKPFDIEDLLCLIDRFESAAGNSGRRADR
jgi:DNA-binding response OmpR family regulator